MDTQGWLASPQNPYRNGERDNLSHLTHWNHERTRGVRIDRVYLNFDIVGATGALLGPVD